MNQVRPAAMRERRDVEWLVNWAIERQRVHTADVRSDVPQPVRSQLGSLGVNVDAGGFGPSGRHVVHPDATIIWSKLEDMRRNARTSAAATLVFQHGRLGTQPDWGREGCGRYVLVRRGNGKAVKRFEDQKNGRGLLGFEWEWTGHTVETLERMMLEWSAWHAALRELVKLINPAMTRYVATGPVWMAEPWNDPAVVRANGEEAA